LDWTPRAVEEKVNQDKAGGEHWRKRPYDMEKYRQKSSGWQGIVYAGDALWNDRMMMMMQMFNNLYTGQSTTNCLPDKNHSLI
jgi:ribonuclease BN (tRNA processing enzyme)